MVLNESRKCGVELTSENAAFNQIKKQHEKPFTVETVSYICMDCGLLHSEFEKVIICDHKVEGKFTRTSIPADWNIIFEEIEEIESTKFVKKSGHKIKYSQNVDDMKRADIVKMFF